MIVRCIVLHRPNCGSGDSTGWSWKAARCNGMRFVMLLRPCLPQVVGGIEH